MQVHKRSIAIGHLVLVMVLTLATSAVAQLDQGQIAGTVRDSSGAIVPSVTVQGVSTQTGLRLSSQTGQNGAYVLTNLPVGYYDVSVEAAGFRKYVQERVRVGAATRTTVDITLELGAVTESVTVQATTMLVQQESAQVSRVVEVRQITDLALSGRNPLNLVFLKAGVVGDYSRGISQFNPDTAWTDEFLINGGRLAGTTVTIDGVNAVRTRSGSSLVGVFNADTIQEVQILASSFPAEYGRAMDGQIRFVSKSGTREFHGGVWHFFRNSALDANSWSRNRSPNPQQSSRPAPFRFNQPGYSLGGPIFIPGKFNNDRSKLFFFVSQEWVRHRQEGTSTATVPTPAMRGGDFGELLSPSNPFFGKVRIVGDPLSGSPFPENRIPPDRLSPNGAAFLRIYPQPVPGFQEGSANWIGSRSAPKNSRKDFIRADYYPGKHRINFSGTQWSYYARDAFQGSFYHAPTVWDRPNKTGAVSITSTLSAHLINDFTFSAAEDKVIMDVQADAVGSAGPMPYYRSAYGIKFPYLFPGTKPIEDRIPAVTISGFASLPTANRPAFSSGPMYTWADNVTWVAKTSHTVKFGATFGREQHNNADQVGAQNGSFSFLDAGHPLSSGVAIANVLLGNFDTYSELGNNLFTLWRSTTFEAYIQDNWKVGPKLTLELGIRYSYHQPWYAKFNDISNFLPDFYNAANQAVVDPAAGFIVSGDIYNGIVLPGAGFPNPDRVPASAIPGVQRLFHNLPRSLVHSRKNAFAPRFGLAYRVVDKTVVRLGGGVFHHRPLDQRMSNNPPLQIKADLVNGQVDAPGGALRRQYPFSFVSRTMDYPYPTAYHYTLSIQRELPAAAVLDVTYVGKTSVNLVRSSNVNQMPAGTIQANRGVNPNALRHYRGFTSISEASYTGRSNYNSLQVTLERRFTSGLGFGLAYTFSKTMENTTSPYDIFAIGWVRCLAAMDVPQLLNVNFIYELPFLRERRDIVGKVFGGWQLSGLVYARSQTPLSVSDSVDVAGTGSGGAPWNLMGSTKVTGERGLDKLWFDPTAFAMPAQGTFGNAGLRILRGPLMQNWDLSMFKEFRFSERLNSQLRWEVFNLPNHPALGAPNTSPRSGFFGYITSKSGERAVQLGLKLTF